MRVIARFEKGEAVRFVSHLDVQRLFQRAFRRAGVPLAYSQGFNPHPLLSFATALAVGYTSEAEWLDIRLEEDMDPAAFIEAVNLALPHGFRILEAHAADEKLPALTALMCAASHAVTLFGDLDIPALRGVADALLLGEIMVEKRTKAGMKLVDIKPQILSVRVEEGEGRPMLLLDGVLDASGSLNVELLMQEVKLRYGADFHHTVHRRSIRFRHEFAAFR